MSEAEKRKAFPVRLVDLPERAVAYLRIANAFAPGRVLAGFTRMLTWAREQHLLDDSTLFGMSLDDPHVTPKHLYRYEVCLATRAAFRPTEAIATLSLPAMRYAAVRVTGDLRRVATAWDYLFRGWLPRSRFEPEHSPALEIYLDKSRATDWSHFDLQLCLPIKKLESAASLYD
jgi:AraC family transcriptional regulator